MDSPDSPLEKSITYADEIELDADQNSFSFQVAALSYQAPEMNGLEYKLEGFDRDWYTVRGGIPSSTIQTFLMEAIHCV